MGKGSKSDVPEKPTTIRVKGKKPPPAVNRWAHVEKKWCRDCSQYSHDIDRDSPPNKPQFVAWSKTKGVGATIRLVGERCTNCYSVTRRHFTETPDQVKEARDKDKCVDDKFLELRLDYVSGTLALKASGVVDIKTFVINFKKNFRQRFSDATNQEIHAFACQRRLCTDDMDALRSHIRKTFLEYTILHDEQGAECVQIPDGPKGSYKVRVGVEEGASVQTRQDHEDNQSANAALECSLLELKDEASSVDPSVRLKDQRVTMPVDSSPARSEDSTAYTAMDGFGPDNERPG